MHDSFCHGFLYPICCTPPDCTACVQSAAVVVVVVAVLVDFT